MGRIRLQDVADEAGVTPMTDEDARPFAGLADLKVVGHVTGIDRRA